MTMNVLMVRAKVDASKVDEVEQAATAMFAAIDAAQPDGVRYASCRLPDGVTFIALLALDEGIDNPLGAIAEFQAFQDNLKGWLVEPPSAEPLQIVGSYNLF